jgi:hypothetical protein
VLPTRKLPGKEKESAQKSAQTKQAFFRIHESTPGAELLKAQLL